MAEPQPSKLVMRVRFPSPAPSRFDRLGYWAEVLTVARALIDMYKPLKMNYETLGNSLPDLHTHLIPRFTHDPRPGQPFPLSAQQPDAKLPEDQLSSDAKALRTFLAHEHSGE
jgi:diadenosine tetraphosphate (Ap4A) HIT family hydrolase